MGQRYHGLLHGRDLLTVDLSQGAAVAFQGGLQSASGLETDEAQTQLWYEYMKALEKGKLGERNHTGSYSTA